jgi:hypothetical protein
VKFEGYKDKYGLMHPIKGQFSENGILHLAEYALTLRLITGKPVGNPKFLNAVIATIVDHVDFKVFDPNPSDNNDEYAHFSHDNMTGLYCLMYLLSFPLKNLPTFKWNHRRWLHPRDILFYSIMKNPVLKFLIPLLAIPVYFSCIAKRNRTSGKCLWFLRLNILNLKYNNFATRSLLKLSEVLMKDLHGSRPYKDSFDVYFKDKEYPIHKLMEKYYDKQEGKRIN